MTQLYARAIVTEFDRTTVLRPNHERHGELAVDLDDGWSSLVGVHGGYSRALVVCGAEALAPGRSLRTSSNRFLRTARVGSAALTVRELRRGRTFPTMVADIVQDDQILTVIPRRCSTRSGCPSLASSLTCPDGSARSGRVPSTLHCW